MRLDIELSPIQAERLNTEAKRLGVSPERLALAALSELWAEPDEAFNEAAERVLRKNDELYRRLA